MKRCGTVVAALAVLVSQSACYTTRVVTNTRPEGPTFTDRQWFTIGGLVSLSQPAGRECRHGISSTESKLNGVDWLIDVGLTVVGGVAGSFVCTNVTDPIQRSGCISGGAALLPFLVSSRTVEYACAEGPAAGPAYMPPPQGPVHPASPPTP